MALFLFLPKRMCRILIELVVMVLQWRNAPMFKVSFLGLQFCATGYKCFLEIVSQFLEVSYMDL